MALPFTAFEPGTVLADRYRLLERIARGGMGDVFAAEDALLHRRVAVKVYRSAAPEDRARFDTEVRLLAGLNHPGLVRVFDAGDHDGDGFVVLELVEGPTLRTALAERGPLGADEVTSIGRGVAQALAYVHHNGVVHRDVTPANILLDADDQPRLADFGIARLLDTTRITANATTLGTAAYMAPEQVRGETITPAVDIYALGLVLSEALTCERPFEGTSSEVAMARLVRDPEIPAAVPGAWRQLLRSMTARDPAARPDADAVDSQLARLTEVADEATGATPAVGAVVGAGAVDAAATTTALPVADVDEGGSPTATAAMPTVLAPDHGAAPAAARSSASARTGLAIAALVLLVVLVAGFASRGTGSDPARSTSTTAAPTTTTTAPTTTVAPAPPPPPDDDEDDEDDEDQGPGGGRGEGRGRSDD